ncbi:hypothetical protein HBB16_12785 [Pseudonocardia sp. MCCB 268]|nr:hypothetical protein [Pseudonocardia cytotoxica]
MLSIPFVVVCWQQYVMAYAAASGSRRCWSVRCSRPRPTAFGDAAAAAPDRSADDATERPRRNEADPPLPRGTTS